MNTKTKLQADLYNNEDLVPHLYEINRSEEKTLLSRLSERVDTEAQRMKRYLAMSDLSRNTESPIHEIVAKVKSLQTFKKFDDICVPEIVTVYNSFDLFDFPADHPARNKSDTYFIDDQNILRTQTTVMWYYYFNLPEIKEKIKSGNSLGAVCYGKVYRKDEIDRNHMNIFHQIDGLYICPKEKHVITQDDLKDVLIEVAQGAFGTEIKYRFNPDTFPYTHSSLEMEVDKNSLNSDIDTEEWVEVLGAGIVQPGVLEKLGIDSEKYNGWAFGFGLERLAIISMELPDIRLLWSDNPKVKNQLKMGTKFVEVSKYPPIVRDISFVVNKDSAINNYFDLVRETAPDIVEEVALLDKYENAEKFGAENISYAFRITYRSIERTLTSAEVDTAHKKLEEVTASVFKATIR